MKDDWTDFWVIVILVAILIVLGVIVGVDWDVVCNSGAKYLGSYYLNCLMRGY